MEWRGGGGKEGGGPGELGAGAKSASTAPLRSALRMAVCVFMRTAPSQKAMLMRWDQ